MEPIRKELLGPEEPAARPTPEQHKQVMKLLLLAAIAALSHAEVVTTTYFDPYHRVEVVDGQPLQLELVEGDNSATVIVHDKGEVNLASKGKAFIYVPNQLSLIFGKDVTLAAPEIMVVGFLKKEDKQKELLKILDHYNKAYILARRPMEMREQLKRFIEKKIIKHDYRILVRSQTSVHRVEGGLKPEVYENAKLKRDGLPQAQLIEKSGLSFSKGYLTFDIRLGDRAWQDGSNAIKPFGILYIANHRPLWFHSVKSNRIGLSSRPRLFIQAEKTTRSKEEMKKIAKAVQEGSIFSKDPLEQIRRLDNMLSEPKNLAEQDIIDNINKERKNAIAQLSPREQLSFAETDFKKLYPNEVIKEEDLGAETDEAKKALKEKIIGLKQQVANSHEAEVKRQEEIKGYKEEQAEKLKEMKAKQKKIISEAVPAEKEFKKYLRQLMTLKCKTSCAKKATDILVTMAEKKLISPNYSVTTISVY